MPDNFIGLIILGLAAGVLSGMFGIGGGVVIVPMLIVFFGFEHRIATGTSLGALMLPVAILACINYYRAGKLKIAIAAPVALGLIFGGWLGAQIAFGLPIPTMKMLYGIFLIYAGWRFVEPRKLWVEYRHTQKGSPISPPPVEDERTASFALLFVVGIGAGIISGLFGVGGGIVIVPALVTLLRFDQKVAVATSLGALLLPVGLPAALVYYNNGELDPATAGMVALGLVFGALVGSRITLAIPTVTVKRLYGLFLFVVALNYFREFIIFATAGG